MKTSKDKKEEPFFTRHVPWGLGYEIIKREGFTRVYITPDKDEVEKALKLLLKHEGDISKLPAPSTKWPIKIMSFNEKHGDRLYIVKTNEDMEKIALSIVIERNNEGWYYEPKIEEFGEELTEDQIAKLPTESLRKAAAEENKKIQREKRNYKTEMQDWNLLQEALKTKNGRMALRFLELRRGGEYERFEITEPANEEEIY